MVLVSKVINYQKQLMHTRNKYLHNTNIFARYIQYGHGNIPLYSKYTFIITYRRVFLSELGHYLYLHRPLRDVFDEE